MNMQSMARNISYHYPRTPVTLFVLVVSGIFAITMVIPSCIACFIHLALLVILLTIPIWPMLISIVCRHLSRDNSDLTSIWLQRMLALGQSSRDQFVQLGANNYYHSFLALWKLISTRPTRHG